MAEIMTAPTADEINAAPSIHPFEAAGLGLAPFRFVGMDEKVYVAFPGAPAQAAGTCDYCGVGCDCIRKTDRDDNRLLTAAERALGNLKRAKKQAELAAKWEAKRVALNAELDRQRSANGGLTDAEVAERKAQAERAAAAAPFLALNAWLLAVLEAGNHQSGGFVDGMIEKLGTMPAAKLSPRCLDILGDMYAKAAGRRGSKAYDAARDEFDAKTTPQD